MPAVRAITFASRAAPVTPETSARIYLPPPNVKGWDGGVSWITTNNLLARYNQAATLVQEI